MPRQSISRRIGQFPGDRRALFALMLIGLAIAARAWLTAYPQHDPWAPLDLRDPVGWATSAKLQALKNNPVQCRTVLTRSDLNFSVLSPAGSAPCLRADRTRLEDYPLEPDSPAVTCSVAAALELWRRTTLEPAAQSVIGKELQAIEHFGAYSCRRLYGRSEGAYSEHATGNAIDVAGFRFVDGTRISVLEDWNGNDDAARFLREARDGACETFATVLSPDYNAEHADHFHLDQSGRWRSVCR